MASQGFSSAMLDATGLALVRICADALKLETKIARPVETEREKTSPRMSMTNSGTLDAPMA